jgi:hypothetical protein
MEFTRLLCTAAVLLVIHPYCMGGEGADEDQFTHQPPVANVKPAPKRWSDVIGRRVQIEGIAWGAIEKGWGPYVIMNGSRVYVDSPDFLKGDVEGKLVRVNGVLQAQRIQRSPPGAQGAAVDFTIYKLSPAQSEKIERVTWPWMQEMP